MTAKELREQRSKLATRIKELADKSHKEPAKFAAEETQNWADVNKDYDALSAQIDIAERAEKVEGEQRSIVKPGREDFDSRQALEDANREEREDEMSDAELGINLRSIKPEVAGLAIQGWMRRVSGLSLDERHVKAARIAGVNLNRSYLDIDLGRRAMTPKEYRALSAVDTSVGASTIAPSFASAFEAATLAFGGMREVAQVLRTDTGAAMPWPTANDTGNEGRIVGENITQTDTDVPTGSATWGAYKYTSDMIKVPVELIEDSAIDLVSEVGRMCGERIARRQNRDFTTGDGASKPVGIVTAAGTGVTTAGSTAITADEVLGLIHSVDPSYRNDPSFGLMMSDAVLLYVRKLKDSQNRYLFQDAVAGAPPTIFGVKYSINQHMATSIVTTAKTMIAGQLNKYKIREVRGLRMRRLVERFADADQEGFVTFARADGNLLNAGVNPVKALVQV